jgi:hypothetical protein
VACPVPLPSHIPYPSPFTLPSYRADKQAPTLALVQGMGCNLLISPCAAAGPQGKRGRAWACGRVAPFGTEEACKAKGCGIGL